jgi:membrane fusion protein, multidrug efflux system
MVAQAQGRKSGGWPLAIRGMLLLLVVGLVLYLAACEDTKSPAAAPVTPATAPSAPTPLLAEVYLTSGLIVVENQLDIAALREGVISRIAADTGKFVHKGELLASVDNRQLSAQHDSAEAKVRSVSFDEKNWEAKVSMEEIDFERSQKMMDALLITRQQLDHARFQLVAARNELERERQDLINAQAELRALDLELEKTRITAPFEGIVARRYVRAGQKVAVGDRLFWITATAPLRVKFTLPERFIGQIKTGGLVTVMSPDPDKVERPARVIQVSPVIDPSSATIEVLAQLQAPTGSLRPGMTLNIRVANRP